jgi:hypothetical protein
MTGTSFMETALPQSGQRIFEARGKVAPRNFTRILSMVLDYQQRVIFDFDARTIKFEDVMLPNRFLTLWMEPEITIGFGDIRKLSDVSFDGKEIFNVSAAQGNAALNAYRFDDFEELRELLVAIHEAIKS